MRLAENQFATSYVDDSSSSNSAGLSKIGNSRLSRSISTSTSSLNIKVSDGHKKTTPPKPAPKRSMRRRRLGDDYHHSNDDQEADIKGKSAINGDSSSSKESRYRTNRRTKRESSDNAGSYKTSSTGRSKGSTSAKNLSNSLRTEEIPIGQWVVLIALVVGLFGYVRHCSKNSSSDKQSVAWKKKDKKKSSIRNHSNTNGRRKGKGHSNSTKSKTNSIKQNTPKKDNSDTMEHNDIDKPTETEEQNANEPPVETPGEVTQEIKTDPLPTRKKKKRVKKKSVKTNIPVVEDVLIPSKASPDSVSTDGSSSANISHQDHDHHSVIEEDFNQSFPHEYVDYAEFEVHRPEEEWTTVVSRASKTHTSDKSEKQESVDSNPPQVHVETSSMNAISQSHKNSEGFAFDTAESTKTNDGQSPSNGESNNNTEIKDCDASKGECEAVTEMSCESDVTPQMNNHASKEEHIDEVENEKDSHVEVEESIVISSLDIEEKELQQNVTTETESSSFSQEDDEALARMLQREEEEMAAAADIQYEMAVVSPKGPKQDDVWEEVKKRRTSKKQATTATVEEQ